MSKLAIGVDIGGTRTKIGLVDIERGIVTGLLVYPTEKKVSDIFLATIGEAINTFKAQVQETSGELAGIGFGVPGFVFEDGVVDSTYGFLEFMEDYPLKKLIEDKHQLPCKLDNDARVVALGEAIYGAGKLYDRVLVLTLGTGLGLGFIAGGKLAENLPYAHMGGHISIRTDGEKCYCGKTGCLEALVSATGLCKAAEVIGWSEKHNDLALTAENIFKMRGENDPDSVRLVDQLMADLQTGIDNYINLFAPELIILGGGLARGLKNDLDKLHDPSLLYPYKNYKTVLVTSQLEEEAGVLGGAALFK